MKYPRFGDIGYADFAIRSYRRFHRLRDLGRIPPKLRFQVPLPPPHGAVSTGPALVSRRRSASASGGLRVYRRYSDLGIDEAPNGAIEAHITAVEARATNDHKPNNTNVGGQILLRDPGWALS